jgi:carboxymethylenebutenolidase
MSGGARIAADWTTIPAGGGASLEAYVARPAQGSGPALVVLAGAAGVDAAIRRLCGELAEEGYVAAAPAFERSGPRGLDAAAALADVADCVAALRSMPGCAGGAGALGFGLGGLIACLAAADGIVDCAVAYDADGIAAHLDRVRGARSPVTLHFGAEGAAADAAALDALRDACAGQRDLALFLYPQSRPGFALRDSAAYDAPSAATAYSRSIAALKRVLGPHFDLEELWDFHLACEFVSRDADAAIRTMVDEPYVNHVPTLTGGFGHDMLKRFYKYHFVGQVPRDRKTIPISRTVGADRIVDEKIFCFTHDTEIDWLLPGVAPTGRYVEIPLVGIVTFRGGRLVNEHIYWDQASVLAQIGLLDPAGLPVAGAEQARKLLDPRRPSNALMPSWRRSEGKPL